jgi:hypothetical protein
VKRNRPEIMMEEEVYYYDPQEAEADLAEEYIPDHVDAEHENDGVENSLTVS